MVSQAPAHAQQVSGRVVDGEQQPIAHAQLSLRHQLLEKTTTVYSDSEGRIVRWYGLIVDISTERRLQYRISALEEQIHRLRGTDQD